MSSRSSYLIAAALSNLGVPMAGEVFMCAKEDTTFFDYWKDWFTNDRWGNVPSTVLGLMTENRNDVMLITPGKYTGTGAAPFTWDKDNTHLVGMTHPVTTDYGGGGVIIRTLSTTGVFAINITGRQSQFHNVAFHNWGQNTAAVCAVKESGYLNIFKGCFILGMARTQTAQNANCCSLWIDTATAPAGNGDQFIDCTIGSNGTPARTNNNGQILFGLTGTVGAGSNMTFTHCQIHSRSATAGCVAIKASANYCLDRLLLLDNCTFYNFRENSVAKLTNVISDSCNTTHAIEIKDCFNLGWTNWGGNATYVPQVTGATPNAEGGIGTDAG